MRCAIHGSLQQLIQATVWLYSIWEVMPQVSIFCSHTFKSTRTGRRLDVNNLSVSCWLRPPRGGLFWPPHDPILDKNVLNKPIWFRRPEFVWSPLDRPAHLRQDFPLRERLLLFLLQHNPNLPRRASGLPPPPPSLGRLSARTKIDVTSTLKEFTDYSSMRLKHQHMGSEGFLTLVHLSILYRVLDRDILSDDDMAELFAVETDFRGETNIFVKFYIPLLHPALGTTPLTLAHFWRTVGTRWCLATVLPSILRCSVEKEMIVLPQEGINWIRTSIIRNRRLKISVGSPASPP